MVYYRKKKSKKYNIKKKKNTKKIKNKTKKHLHTGGGNCKSYIVTGAHGFIVYDKEQFITIPDNIRLVVYSDFCGKSCNNIKNIINYICNDKQDKINEIAYNFLNSGSIIPELYVLPDKKDNIKLSDCDNNIIYQENFKQDKTSNKAVPLSVIIEKLKIYLKDNNLENVKIDLHWTLCLDVIDKERLKIENPDNSIITKNKYEYKESDLISAFEYLLNPCNEDLLGIQYNSTNSDYSDCKIKIKKNTILIISNIIADKNVKIYLTYPHIIKIRQILPLLITRLEENKYQIIEMLFDKIKSHPLNPELTDYVDEKLNEYIQNKLIPDKSQILEKIVDYNINNNDITINVNMTGIDNQPIINIIRIILYFSVMNLPI